LHENPARFTKFLDNIKKPPPTPSAVKRFSDKHSIGQSSQRFPQILPTKSKKCNEIVEVLNSFWLPT
jgi:hypothetical protein